MKQKLSKLSQLNSILLTLLALIFSVKANAQISNAFKYQTVVRNSLGQPIANQSMSFRISIHSGNAQGNVLYSEILLDTTSDAGIANLLVGTGQVIIGNFTQIDWSSGDFYMQIEVDPNGSSNYLNMGTSALASVPFALYARSSAGASLWSGDSHSVYFNGSVGVNGPVMVDPSGMDTILFEVHDSYGYPILRVTESGIRMYIKSGTKSNKGGFQVYGSPDGGSHGVCLMTLTADSIRFYIADTLGLGGRGGFKVQGYKLGSNGLKSRFTPTETIDNEVSMQDKLLKLENTAAELQIHILELEKQNKSLLEQMRYLKTVVEKNNIPDNPK